LFLICSEVGVILGRTRQNTEAKTTYDKESHSYSLCKLMMQLGTLTLLLYTICRNRKYLFTVWWSGFMKQTLIAS